MYYRAIYDPTTGRVTLVVLSHDFEQFMVKDIDNTVLFTSNEHLRPREALKVTLTGYGTNLFLVTPRRRGGLIVHEERGTIRKRGQIKLKGIEEVISTILDRTINEVIGEFSIL